MNPLYVYLKDLNWQYYMYGIWYNNWKLDILHYNRMQRIQIMNARHIGCTMFRNHIINSARLSHKHRKQ